jgi:hypothetical protein
MMLANDKRRGSRHPEQICKRHNLDRNKPLTLELLAEKCKIDISDLINIHDKYAQTTYKKEQKREADPFHDKNGKVKLGEVLKALDMLSKSDKKIKAIGTVKKLEAINNVINNVNVPKKPPVLKKEKGYTTKIDEKAFLKVYEFVNRLERYKLGQLKHPPGPKKIANKYL